MSRHNRDGSRTVIHVLTSLDFGGVEKRMEILARSTDMGARRHHFCAIGRGGAAEKRIEAASAQVDCLGQPTAIPSIRSIWTLVRIFRRLKPQVVHTHGAEANFHGLIAAWLAGVPIRIGEEIGIPEHSAKARLVFRQVYRLAHRVIGISNSVTEWLVDSGELPKSKAVRIYNPVELAVALMSTPGKVPGRFRLGFVGRLEPVKNPLVLIEAVAKLRAEGIPAEVWLVGDGSQLGMLETRTAELGVGEHVRFLGYRDAPMQFVSQCDFYVQPSLSEGFGLALVEAMSCGVPVLATAVGGAPEIIEHGRTGWLLEQSTVEQLVAALRHIWNDRDSLASVGRAGREAVVHRFKATEYVSELGALYDAVR
ncbi:MAG: glycosyltransferase [Pseudohongiellaceae bacterium]